MSKTLRYLTLAAALMAAAFTATAQTTAPTANDPSLNIFNGVNFNTRYIDANKTGALQFMMFGQDPTPGAPVGQLRPQQRILGPSIVCGAAGGSTCDVVATAVSVYSSQIADSTAPGRAVLTASDATAARMAIGAGTSSFDGSYTSLTSVPGTFTPATHMQAFSTITATPTTLAGYGIADAYPLSGNPSAFITSGALTPYLTSATAASTYATSAGMTSALAAKADTTALTSGLATKQATVTLSTTGSGAATFNSGTGVLNIPTPAAATAFNFSQPAARTLAVSTSYQAIDNTKAAVIYPSYACQNATQVLASSACTLQVRMGTGTLTCATGTIYYTQSLSVALGVLITQNSTNPVPIFLPAGASMIMCPTTGTFTVSVVEQSAG